MKNTLRLLATTSLVAFLGVPAFAQTEIDIASMTCTEFGAMEGEALVAVIEAIGAMPLADDQMAEDGVANTAMDPGTDATVSTDESDTVDNAMSDEDVATDALQANSGSDDLGATITAACADMGDMTVVEALKASTN